MVEIEIDGQKVEVAEGSMVMHAAAAAADFARRLQAAQHQYRQDDAQGGALRAQLLVLRMALNLLNDGVAHACLLDG